MRLVDIQAWAYRSIEALLAEQPTEDTTVELKTTWPVDHPEAARRIAGQANAARGHPILWLIGVNQNARTVPGVPAEELSTWWAQVKKHFADDVHPEIQDLVLPYEGDARIVALAFATETPPYAVKRPNQSGVPDIEVPWREGTSTRPANRRELVLLLADAVELPEIDVRWAWVNADVGDAQPDTIYFRGELGVYIDSVAGKQVVFPFHRCSATLSGSPESWSSFELPNFSARAKGGRPHIATTAEDVILTGPGGVRFELWGSSPLPVDPPDGVLELRLELWPTRSDLPVRSVVRLPVRDAYEVTDGSDLHRGWRWTTGTNDD